MRGVVFTEHDWPLSPGAPLRVEATVAKWNKGNGNYSFTNQPPDAGLPQHAIKLFLLGVLTTNIRDLCFGVI